MERTMAFTPMKRWVFKHAPCANCKYIADEISLLEPGSELLATSVAWRLSCARKMRPTSRAKRLWLLGEHRPDSDFKEYIFCNT